MCIVPRCRKPGEAAQVVLVQTDTSGELPRAAGRRLRHVLQGGRGEGRDKRQPPPESAFQGMTSMCRPARVQSLILIIHSLGLTFISPKSRVYKFQTFVDVTSVWSSR